MYANLIKAPKHRRRRKHSEDFKAQLVAACLQPGISIAAVALANGLNANLLRRWVKEHRDEQQGVGDGRLESVAPLPPTLVPVTLSSPEVEISGDIKIEIHRQQAVFEITWPVSQAAICAQWLREVLR
jgi:transposase-like protein